MIMNEKIKVSVVQLVGINGEDLGIVPTSEALAMAKKMKVDLVCTSLMSSPPPCKLIGVVAAKQEAQQVCKQKHKPKLKEIHFTPKIEEHDYETKKKQAERTLKSGDAVLLVVRIQGKEGAKAKEMLETLLKDLSPMGCKKIGIQLSGKQASAQIDPL